MLAACLPQVSPVWADSIPASVNFNHDFNEFIAWVEASAGEKEIPGAALAIVSRDDVRDLRTWGVRTVGEPGAVATDSIFRIASMSKTFAGTAATLLVQENLVSWDSPIAELFPGLQLGAEPGHLITFRHVASQSTGLMPHSYSNLLDAGVDYQQIKEKFPEIPNVCPPGECYGYQNVVFSLIGDVVETSTGESYDRYLQEKLFLPLGMMTASVGMGAYQESGQATSPHRRVRNGWRATSTNPAYYSTAPAAGINASVNDMVIWLRAHLGAFPEVLSPEILLEAHAPVIATPYGNYFNRWPGLDEAYYGIGWRVLDYRGVRAIHHGGGVRGYRSEMVFVPAADIGMVLLLNAESNYANDVVPAFLDTLIDISTGTSTGSLTSFP